ncbi:hypothetical protein [Nostoc sp. TCL26-01]|uniref:hypothetical protein n=1 Tax=Nostoc sp. TCL26-01 TaxID=2576904 RepID=UPI0015BC5543|nr:hypothetical protein [Nostoc sp. TCL26-01]QLE54417.1 hypothetical protein FD725_02145 [Nostoc sp. TCL26-01]
MNSQAVINPVSDLDFLAELATSAIDSLDYTVTQAMNNLRADDSLDAQFLALRPTFIYKQFIYQG